MENIKDNNRTQEYKKREQQNENLKNTNNRSRT